MAHIVKHYHKPSGVTYVYESVSRWDPQKKQSRSKQVCIGKLDPGTGEFIPSKRLKPEQATARDPGVTATAAVIGPSVILDVITEQLEIQQLLKSCFPKHYLQILSLVYYLTVRGGPLSHSEVWCKTHEHPYGKVITSQRISELLGSISEDGKQSFFSQWMQRIADDEVLCYDVTSISSFAQANEYIKYGYNRDREKLPQLNLALLFGQHSRLPIYYHRLPGNITDVTTLHGLLETCKALDVRKSHYVLDKGFYSRKNVDALLAARNKFTLSVPLKNKWVQHAIDDIHEAVHGPEGYERIDDEVVYVHTRLYPWGTDRRRCYLHLYYNAYARAQEVDRFSQVLIDLKASLEAGADLSDMDEAYQKYFIITDTPKRGRSVAFNTEETRTYTSRYAGFHALLSNGAKNPVEALQIYRDKDRIEKCFDDLKNQLDMNRLRMHSSAVVDGRMFIQFLALIYMSALRREMRKSSLIKQYTVRELLWEMETLMKIKYAGKYGCLITEITKPQRELLEKLGIPLPTKT